MNTEQRGMYLSLGCILPSFMWNIPSFCIKLLRLFSGLTYSGRCCPPAPVFEQQQNLYLDITIASDYTTLKSKPWNYIRGFDVGYYTLLNFAREKFYVVKCHINKSVWSKNIGRPDFDMYEIVYLFQRISMHMDATYSFSLNNTIFTLVSVFNQSGLIKWGL